MGDPRRNAVRVRRGFLNITFTYVTSQIFIFRRAVSRSVSQFLEFVAVDDVFTVLLLSNPRTNGSSYGLLITALSQNQLRRLCEVELHVRIM